MAPTTSSSIIKTPGGGATVTIVISKNDSKHVKAEALPTATTSFLSSFIQRSGHTATPSRTIRSLHLAPPFLSPALQSIVNTVQRNGGLSDEFNMFCLPNRDGDQEEEEDDCSGGNATIPLPAAKINQGKETQIRDNVLKKYMESISEADRNLLSRLSPLELASVGPRAFRVNTLLPPLQLAQYELGSPIKNPLTHEIFADSITVKGVRISVGDCVVVSHNTAFNAPGGDGDATSSLLTNSNSNLSKCLRNDGRAFGLNNLPSNASFGARTLRCERLRDAIGIDTAFAEARDSLSSLFSEDIDDLLRGSVVFGLPPALLASEEVIVRIGHIVVDSVAGRSFAHVQLLAPASLTPLGIAAPKQMLVLVSRCATVSVDDIIRVESVGEIDFRCPLLLREFGVAVKAHYLTKQGEVPLDVEDGINLGGEALYKCTGNTVPFLFFAAARLNTKFFFSHSYDPKNARFSTGAAMRRRAVVPATEMVLVGSPNNTFEVSVPRPSCDSCDEARCDASKKNAIALDEGSTQSDGTITHLACSLNGGVISVGGAVYAAGIFPHFIRPFFSSDGFKAAAATRAYRNEDEPESPPLVHSDASSLVVVLITRIYMTRGRISIEGVPLVTAKQLPLPSKIVPVVGSLERFLLRDSESRSIPINSIVGVCQVFRDIAPAFTGVLRHVYFVNNVLGGAICDYSGGGNKNLLATSGVQAPLGRVTLSELDMIQWKGCSCNGTITCPPFLIPLESPDARKFCSLTLDLLKPAPKNTELWPRLSKEVSDAIGGAVDPRDLLWEERPSVLAHQVLGVEGFSGAGIMSLGVTSSGACSIDTAVECVPSVANTLLTNLKKDANVRGHPHPTVIQEDMATLLEEKKGHILPPGRAGFAFGGSPCTGFAGSNTSGDSPASKLARLTMLTHLSFLTNSCADGCLAENVPAFGRFVHASIAAMSFIACGQSVQMGLFSMSPFAPTKRIRCIFMAASPFRHLAAAPLPIHSTLVPPGCAANPDFTVGGVTFNATPDCLGGAAPLESIFLETVLQGLPVNDSSSQTGSVKYTSKPSTPEELARRGGSHASATVRDHDALQIPELHQPLVLGLPLIDAASTRDLPQNLLKTLHPGIAINQQRGVHRPSAFGLANTLTATGTSFTNKSPPPLAIYAKRMMTLREYARIQTIPDDVNLGVGSERIHAIGNSFPMYAAAAFGFEFVLSRWGKMIGF